jgi:hypothetical protein
MKIIITVLCCLLCQLLRFHEHARHMLAAHVELDPIAEQPDMIITGQENRQRNTSNGRERYKRDDAIYLPLAITIAYDSRTRVTIADGAQGNRHGTEETRLNLEEIGHAHWLWHGQ